TFVWALSHSHSLADGAIPTTNSNRGWHGSSTPAPPRHLWIHTRRIRPGRLGVVRSRALCGNSGDVLGAADEDARVVGHFAVVEEYPRAVNVKNCSGTSFAGNFFDGIANTDFGSVSVCGHGIAAADLVRNLRVEDGAGVAVLVQYLEGSFVDTNNAGNS